jgi:hypothetical protein
MESLEKKLIALFDTVSRHLESDPDIDKFLDNTLLFEEWEKIIPEAEYPIFVIAVLNDIRRPSIIETIITSINQSRIRVDDKSIESIHSERITSFGDQPFS